MEVNILKFNSLFNFNCSGLSGGEEKAKFWRVVGECCKLIPEGIPRYVMGVGWPIDLVVASILGADMFDCVYVTRTAR